MTEKGSRVREEAVGVRQRFLTYWRMSHLPSSVTLLDVDEKTAGDEDRVLQPYRYTIRSQGKQMRSKLIDCFQVWLKLDRGSLDSIKQIAESLHTSSLMIDDIEDNTLTRRGSPAAFTVFGVPSTINSANLVYFLALESCRNLKNDKAMEIFCKEMVQLHMGQGLDIYWRDHMICPSLEQYRAMISNKTGGLFRLTIGLMLALSTSIDPIYHCKLISLVDQLGLLYQIRDDFLNLTSLEYQQTRNSFADDLTEGKFSFPIIHCILQNPKDTRLMEILRLRTSDETLKRRAVDIMKDSGSLEATRRELEKWRSEITKSSHELQELFGENILFCKVLDALSHY